jgi:predicted nucleic acid-binding protein
MTEASGGEPGPHLLDANIVLRYLLGDHPEHAARAQALIESEQAFQISIVTLAEVGYLLTRVAGVPRADAIDALIDLLNRENLAAHEVETDLAIHALRLCRPSGRVNFGDAMLWAVARAAGPARVWTFDRTFPSDGIEVRTP